VGKAERRTGGATFSVLAAANESMWERAKAAASTRPLRRGSGLRRHTDLRSAASVWPIVAPPSGRRIHFFPLPHANLSLIAYFTRAACSAILLLAFGTVCQIPSA
jgi:hypothetical protein